MFRHLCNLGKDPLRRIVLEDDRLLIVETGANRKSRIARIDASTGKLSCESTHRPRIKSVASDCVGSRWISTTNRKNPQVSEIQWQDVDSGPIYDFTIDNYHSINCSCPVRSDLVFVGTRKSSQFGDGKVHCLRKGTLLWEYDPQEVAEYAHWANGLTDNVLGTSLQKAFPYRLLSSPLAKCIVFSFLNYLYVLDRTGTLVMKHGMGELLETLFHTEFGNHDIRPGGDKTTHIGAATMRLNVRLAHIPTYTTPVVQALSMSPKGHFFVVGSRNALLWITPKGNIAHSILIDEGIASGPRFEKTITRVVVSLNGDLVADIDGVGLFRIRNGQVDRKWDSSGCLYYRWAYNSSVEMIAIKKERESQVVVLDNQLDCIGEIQTDGKARDVQFSPRVQSGVGNLGSCGCAYDWRGNHRIELIPFFRSVFGFRINSSGDCNSM